MEFSEEFVKDNELNEKQIEAIKGYVTNDYLPTIKKDWDGKANENAEGILTGAAKYAAEKTGISIEREKGEKYGDYLQRITDASFETKKAELEKKQAEFETKLKNFKGSDEQKEKLEKLQADNDSLLKKIAELEPLQGLDIKYKEATEQLSGLKETTAFNSVKPNFPAEVNKYEADAKWSEFVASVKEKYTIELVDGKPKAIDKENHHKQVELSTLLEADENIKKLLEGRQQQGTNAKPLNLKDIDGVPFKVPENATGEERSKLIREYLASKGIAVTDSTYADKFSELNKKISSAKAA